MAAVLLLYFNVSGGPIGAEPLISSAGPLVGLVGLCIFPFLWSVQIAMMTAELSSAFPTNGGYSVWVTEVRATQHVMYAVDSQLYTFV